MAESSCHPGALIPFRAGFDHEGAKVHEEAERNGPGDAYGTGRGNRPSGACVSAQGPSSGCRSSSLAGGNVELAWILPCERDVNVPFARSPGRYGARTKG
jgi:hypothetical protein